MFKCFSARFSIATIVVCAAAAGPVAAQTITALDPLPGGSATWAYGINSNGTAATGYSRSPQFIGWLDTPTRWSVPSPGSSAPVSLGILPAQGSSYGVGMSDDGNVITGYSGGSFGKGFRWAQSPNPTPGLSDLGLLGGGTYLVGRQISGNGLVIVGWGDTTDNFFGWIAGPQNAFRWTGQGGGNFTALGTFGGNQSQAIGVNYDGSVICGRATDGLGTYYAFRWQGGNLQNLGLLPNGTFSAGYAISSDGSTVVGQADVGAGPTNTRAFRWRNNVLTNIGYLPPGTNGTAAYAVSGDGAAVVGESGYFQAMLWTEALGMVNLASYLSSIGVNLSGWVLNDCRAISPDGTCLVGNGSNGAQRGWLVKVPYLQVPMPVLHPTPQTVCGPTTVTFNARITAIGGGHLLTYWRLNGASLSDGPTGSGSTISGSQTDTLTITNAGPADNGLYDFVGFNFYNSATTNSAQLTVNVSATGAFGPGATAACAGSTASMITTPVPLNGGPYLYQWRKNSFTISDGPTGNGSSYSGTATNNLTILSSTPADNGTYDCIISTPGCGFTYSPPGGLLVWPSNTADGNLSGQANGADIPGFIYFLLNGGGPGQSYCAYDMNSDGVVNLADLPGFVAKLLM